MNKERVLIADDEPHYLEWLQEFLEAKGFSVEFCHNVNAASEALNKTMFRAVIADLNIPATGNLKSTISAKGEAYKTYPGLYLANLARNKGHRTKQVIVYSVHVVDDVSAECKKLMCEYIAKGRPSIFKQQIMDVLSYDPTATTPLKRSSRRRSTVSIST